MNIIRVHLFGKFRLQCGERDQTNLYTRKMQELLCYLLLHRDRPRPREALANLLCGETPTAQSKKCLRQVLWNLQTVLANHIGSADNGLLEADLDWIQINSVPSLWLDVAVFEQAFSSVQGVPVQSLSDASIQSLKDAVQLYRGDLLTNWYQDWCLYERERLQTMYLLMLDKLMSCCEANHQYEAGLSYGMEILGYERARERTYRQLMRLYYLAGDRTEALRQYERCVAVLAEELQVEPAQSTVALYEQIRSDHLDFSPALPAEPGSQPNTANRNLAEALGHLRQIQADLVDISHQVQYHIRVVEQALLQQR